MTVQRQRLGRYAEDMVAARLAADGWTVVERNARSRYGELDIVALDAADLVFVEVKAGRVGSSFGPERPALAVGFQKQRRIRRLAGVWMARRRHLPYYRDIRFDVVGVSFDQAGEIADYEHIRAAF